MYLDFCSIVIIFIIHLSSVCLMMINIFDRKLTFYFLNTSDGFLRLRPQIHTSSSITILVPWPYVTTSKTSFTKHFTKKHRAKRR